MFRQFKYSEAILKDEMGEEFGFVGAALGNRYLCAAYAWLTDGKIWVEPYKQNRMKFRVKDADLISKDNNRGICLHNSYVIQG